MNPLPDAVVAGFSRGEITDDKYKSFLEHVRSKLETMVNEGKTIKVQKYIHV